MLCNEVLTTSFLIAVKGELRKLPCHAIMAAEFPMFLLFTKHLNVSAIYRGRACSGELIVHLQSVSAINNGQIDGSRAHCANTASYVAFPIQFVWRAWRGVWQ